VRRTGDDVLVPSVGSGAFVADGGAERLFQIPRLEETCFRRRNSDIIIFHPKSHTILLVSLMRAESKLERQESVTFSSTQVFWKV